MSIDLRSPVRATPAAARPSRAVRRRRLRRWAKIAVLVVLALLILPTYSFVQAMTYPGNAPASVRAVEWVRDHGGGGIVDRVETWLYSRDAPAATGPPADRLSASSGRTLVKAPNSGAPAPRRPTTQQPSLPGEGVWTIPRRATGGSPGAVHHLVSTGPDAPDRHRGSGADTATSRRDRPRSGNTGATRREHARR